MQVTVNFVIAMSDKSWSSCMDDCSGDCNSCGSVYCVGDWTLV